MISRSTIALQADQNQCTLNQSLDPTDTCFGAEQLKYVPSLGGNAFYLAFFVICLGLQAFFAFRHKTWGFLVGMAGGLFLEIIGYIGRIMLHNNPFDHNAFLMYVFEHE